MPFDAGKKYEKVCNYWIWSWYKSNIVQGKAVYFSQERNAQGAVTFVFANFGSACTRNVGM